MTIEGIITEIAEILDKEGFLKVDGIHESDHKPHPFTIGPKHLAKAKEISDGELTEEILIMYPCDAPGCKKPIGMHSTKRELILQLRKDTPESKAQEELLKLQQLFTKHTIQTISFADTVEGYLFLKS